MKYCYAILFLLLLSGCSKRTYVKTGFYYLSDNDRGIALTLAGSAKMYYLEPKAFASADHISSVAIEETKSGRESYRELCLQFDPKGTIDFEKGTENPLQRPVAVVIANRLLYVFSKTERVTTGKVCIYANDFSFDELITMKRQIEKKQ